jgi:hypothetical protein
MEMTPGEPQSAMEYGDRTTAAVKSVLVEIGQILGAFKGKFAMIGGAVPWLLLENDDMPPVGTLDVGLGLDAEALRDGEYAGAACRWCGSGDDLLQDGGDRRPDAGGRYQSGGGGCLLYPSVACHERPCAERPVQAEGRLRHLLLHPELPGRSRGGLVHHSDRGSQYVSIKYTERLAEAGIEPSVGSVGDSYDNALAETINGLYKAEVIHRRGPWRSFEAVEFATLEWVDWFNNRRLLEPIGNIPPAEAEERYYATLDQPAMAA